MIRSSSPALKIEVAMGFLVKVAAGAVIGTITVVLVLATLIDQARPAGERDGGGPLALLTWFTILVLVWAAWSLGAWALRALLRRKTP